jgi:uncharacterized phage protein (TIGR02218 family)
MTFIAQEQGVETGSPVELYEISYESQTWRYTSGDAPFYDAATTSNYEPLLLNRGNILFSSDFGKSTLDVEVQNDAPFLALFRFTPPSGVVSLTVRRFHRTDGALQIVSLWKGRILSVTWGDVSSTLTCEPIRASVQRIGLRRLFQRQCPHVLYSAACGVSKALYEVVGNVESISGVTINITGVSSFAAGYFAGGFIEYVSSAFVTTERRMITANAGGTNQLILVTPTLGLAVGDEVRVYPGCDHTLDTNGCVKFDNTINYGGKPYTPTKNPFGGEPVY